MRWQSSILLIGGTAAVIAGVYSATDSRTDPSVLAASGSPAAIRTLQPSATAFEAEAATAPADSPEGAQETASADEVDQPSRPDEDAVGDRPSATAEPTATATSVVVVPLAATPAPPPPTPAAPRPTATTSPAAPPPAASVTLVPLEQSMFAAHNAERANAGLGAFGLDATLTQVARQRAQDMASKGYFSHISPTGQTAFTLLNATGYRYSLAGENLARNNYPDSQSVSVAMSAFMASQSHRVNILEPKFTRVGVGMAVGADGLKYFAVVFAAP